MLNKLFRKSWSRGAALVEYSLLMALVVVVSLFAVLGTGNKTSDIFCYAAVALGYAMTCEDKAPELSAKVVEIVAPECRYYRAGDEIMLTAVYDKAVTSADASIDLDIGGTIRKATLKSGSGTDRLTFAYIASVDDEDLDGISFSSFKVAGDVRDAAKTLAEPSFDEDLADLSCVKVAQIAQILQVQGPACGEYRPGDEILFKVGYDKPVFTTDATIELIIGSANRTASLKSGSGSETLTFAYVMADNDADANGIQFANFNVGGTVADETGGTPSPDFTDKAPDLSCVKAALPAQVIAMTGPTCKEYQTGEEMTFQITYDKVVTSTDAFIEIDVNGTIRKANLKSGSNTTKLVFAYTPVAGETDSNGITFANTIVGGTVMGVDGGPAKSDFGSKAPSMTCVKVVPPATCDANCAYAGMTNGKIVKMKPDGTIVTTMWPQSSSIQAMAIGPDRSIHVSVGATSSYKVIKYDNAGAKIWERTLPRRTDFIAVTKDKEVVLGDSAGNILKFSETGTQHSTTVSVKATGQSTDEVTGLIVDDKGFSFSTSKWGAISKVRLSNMTKVWETRPSGVNQATGIAMAANGRIYVGGYSVDTGSAFDSDGFMNEAIYGYTEKADGTGLTYVEGWSVATNGGAIRKLAAGWDNRVIVTSRPSKYVGAGMDYNFGFKSGTSSAVFSRRTNLGNVEALELDRLGVLWVAGQDGSTTFIERKNPATGSSYGSSTQPPGIVRAFAFEPGRYGQGY